MTKHSKSDVKAKASPGEKHHTLYQELKSSGSVDNPVKYTETHLKGGFAHEP